MGSRPFPKLPAGPTHTHHPAAAEPPKAWPGSSSPSPSQTLLMQVEGTGLQWVLDPSSTLLPKRDSLATASSAPPEGRAPRAGHAQRARRLRAGLQRLGMRRGRSACGRGSWTEHAHGLLPDPAIRADGRGGRPGAAPGRAPSTCEKNPRREEAPPTPIHTRQHLWPTCQRSWRLLPPPRSHALLPFPAPWVLSKPRVPPSPPPSPLPGLQADLSGENAPTHSPLVPFPGLPLLSSEKTGIPGLPEAACLRAQPWPQPLRTAHSGGAPATRRWQLLRSPTPPDRTCALR